MSNVFLFFLECEADEVRDGDSCYRFITESRRTHEGALLDCIERNSHLVYIESMEEQNFIVSRASTLIRIDYWIGIDSLLNLYCIEFYFEKKKKKKKKRKEKNTK